MGVPSRRVSGTMKIFPFVTSTKPLLPGPNGREKMPLEGGQVCRGSLGNGVKFFFHAELSFEIPRTTLSSSLFFF